jgi:hypothetical protein
MALNHTYVTLAIALAFGGGSTGCSGGEEEPVKRVGDGCTHYTDPCDPPLYCNYDNRCAEPKPFGEYCGKIEECASGLCAIDGLGRHMCSKPCSTDAECEGFLCVESICAGPCTPADETSYPGVCIDGRPISCSNLPADRCNPCGCLDTEFCQDQACLPRLAEGTLCQSDEQCISNNCGVPQVAPGTEPVCLVGLGQACTNANCSFCRQEVAFCSKECFVTSDCVAPASAPLDMMCVKGTSDSHASCNPTCTDSTCSAWPGAMCTPVRDSDEWVCDL